MSDPWEHQKDPAFFLSRKDNIRTRLGVVLPGREDFLFQGKRQFAELTQGGATYQDLLVLAITGRSLSHRERRILDAMVAVTTYGDPRLWFHQAARFAMSERTRLGTALIAGLAVVESKTFGGYATLLASRFFQKTLAWVRSGQDLEDLIQEKLARRETIYGFGRPIVRRDERIEPFRKVFQEEGFKEGPHYRLAQQIEQILRREKDIILNFGGTVSAIFSDMGFSPEEISLLCLTHFIPSTLAAVAEGAERPPRDFLPLACDEIEYQGPGERKLERGVEGKRS